MVVVLSASGLTDQCNTATTPVTHTRTQTNTPWTSFINFLSRRRASGGIRSYVLLNLSRNKQWRHEAVGARVFLVPAGVTVLHSCCWRVLIWTRGFAHAVCFHVLFCFFFFCKSVSLFWFLLSFVISVLNFELLFFLRKNLTILLVLIILDFPFFAR